MEHNKQILTNAYEKYGDAIFRYCFFRISDREKALDFVSETFIRMWQYLLNGNEIVNTKTFLYTCARHIIIDEYRKKKTISLDYMNELGIELSVKIDESVYSDYDINHVMKCVQDLPENYSSILTMRYVDDLSIKEIAKVTDETENVISVRIHRGLHKLREMITL